MSFKEKIKEKLKLRFRKDRKAKGKGVIAIGFIAVVCCSVLAVGIYAGLNALGDKFGVNVDVSNNGGGGSATQDTYYPAGYNVKVLDADSKAAVASTTYAFGEKYQYPSLETEKAITSISYVSGASVELAGKEELPPSPYFDGKGFWAYTEPSGYKACWKYIEYKREVYDADDDKEIILLVEKAGSIVESGSTTTTNAASNGTPSWSTTVVSTYKDNVVMLITDGNASNSEISSVTFSIDGISQNVNKFATGQWYTICNINGTKTLSWTATRKSGADANASITMAINELNPTGATDYLNNGDNLFSETNTD